MYRIKIFVKKSSALLLFNFILFLLTWSISFHSNWEHKKFQNNINGATVTVSGFLPKNVECDIKEVENNSYYNDCISDAYDSKEKSYKLCKAYDINLYQNGKIWEPDEHGTNVTVSISGIPSNTNYVVHRIEDNNAVTDINSGTENGFVFFCADHFTVYTVGEETIDTSMLNVADGYPVTYLGLTCTLYDDGTMTVEGTQSKDSNNSIYTTAPWYQNSTVQTIYADYNANGYAQACMFAEAKMQTFTTGSNFNSTAVSDMSGMFQHCDLLTSVKTSSFDTSSVTNMTGMFDSCSTLTSLDLSNFDTSHVLYMPWMFNGCFSLTQLNIDSFNTQNVTSMESMFANCALLTSVNVSSFDTRNVINMNYMFLGCHSLIALDLGNFDMSSITSAEYMLFGFTYNQMKEYISSIGFTEEALQSAMGLSIEEYLNMFLHITPDVVKPKLATIQTPCNCTLTNINLPAVYRNSEDSTKIYNTLPANMSASQVLLLCEDTTWQNDYEYTLDTAKNLIILSKYIGGATELTVPGAAIIDAVNYRVTFDNLSSETGSIWSNVSTTLTSLSFEEGILLNKDSSYLFYNLSALTDLDVSKLDTSNVIYFHRMFQGCSGLTTLDVSNFNTHCAETMYNMFRSCSSLVSLDLSNFDTHVVVSMANMFRDCSSLTSLNLSSFDTSSVNAMEGMFEGCSSLSELNLSNFTTSNVTNMYGMFRNCSALTELNLSNFDTSNVTNMEAMFQGCKNLQTLNIVNFTTDKVTNMGSMFYGCSSLLSLDVSKFVTSKVTNMWGMFYRCQALTILDVSNFETKNCTNMASMFAYCTNLKELNLSCFNTSKVTDVNRMFKTCESLTLLDLSSFDFTNVTNVEKMVYKCSALEVLNTPYNNTLEIELPATLYTYPLNTAYSSIPAGTTDSMELHSEKKANGYTISMPASVDLVNNQAHFSITFTPEEAFEENAKVVLTFDPDAKIEMGTEQKGVSVNSGSNVVEFTMTEIKEKEVTLTIPNNSEVQAGEYSTILDFSIEKVYSDAS